MSRIGRPENNLKGSCNMMGSRKLGRLASLGLITLTAGSTCAVAASPAYAEASVTQAAPAASTSLASQQSGSALQPAFGLIAAGFGVLNPLINDLPGVPLPPLGTLS